MEPFAWGPIIGLSCKFPNDTNVGANFNEAHSALHSRSRLLPLWPVLLACLCYMQAAEALQGGSTAATSSGSETMSRSEVTSIIAEYRKIVTPNGVEELLPLQINGSTQWISIRGRDRRNPILLFLHGGQIGRAH